MPRYEYSCSTCGQTFEKNMPFNGNQPEVHCPSGHRSVRRVYSAPPVLFKCSGWYSIDHRKSGYTSGES